MAMTNLGMELVAPVGVTAIRTWGAFFLGTGLIGLIGAARRDWIPLGLGAVFIIGALVVTARLYGIAVDGTEEKQISELTDESLGPLLAGLGLLLVWLHKRRNRTS